MAFHAPDVFCGVAAVALTETWVGASLGWGGAFGEEQRRLTAGVTSSGRYVHADQHESPRGGRGMIG